MSRFRAALVAFAAVTVTVLTAGCAAGQHAATSEEGPSVDGSQGTVGKILLNGVALQAPSGDSYAKGDPVGLIAHITNNGTTSDTLTDVSSDAFTGWKIVPTDEVGNASQTTTGSGSDSSTSQVIEPGKAVAFGLVNLTPSGGTSANTIQMTGLGSTLYPANSVKIKFSFAKAGSITITVPVQLPDEGDVSQSPAA